jgi:hypothetical protein
MQVAAETIFLKFTSGVKVVVTIFGDLHQFLAKNSDFLEK